MKTFSIIFIIFVFGSLGWFGFTNETRHIEPVKKTNNRKVIEQQTRLKENYISQLELEIQEKQTKLEKR